MKQTAHPYLHSTMQSKRNLSTSSECRNLQLPQLSNCAAKMKTYRSHIEPLNDVTCPVIALACSSWIGISCLPDLITLSVLLVAPSREVFYKTTSSSETNSLTLWQKLFLNINIYESKSKTLKLMLDPGIFQRYHTILSLDLRSTITISVDNTGAIYSRWP